jgi:hypothetical protein
MKVFNLRCALGHAFEGWFASEDDHRSQVERGLLACPLCGDQHVMRLPSAPRLNLSGGARETEVASDTGPTPPQAPQAADPVQRLQGMWLQAVQQVIENTEDVGKRFPEEARRMHHGETEARSIRGQATAQEREELRDEGIEVHALPMPKALAGPRH